MTKSNRKRHLQRGITLIEMLVVVVIIGLFVSLVGVNMFKKADDANGPVTGTYTWYVSYVGNGNNCSAVDQGGTNEQTVVSKANPKVVTTASPTGTTAIGTTPPTLSDSAVLSGGFFETGTSDLNITCVGVFAQQGPNRGVRIGAVQHHRLATTFGTLHAGQ